MKKISTTLIVAAALVGGALSSQAAVNWNLFSYTDVLVSHWASGTNIYTTNPGANTWNDPVNLIPPTEITGWASDGDASANNGFRYRSGTYGSPFSGGPGNVSYNADAYQTVDNWSPDGYTQLTGLAANSQYTVALYGVVAANSDKNALSYSFNNGVTWSSPIDRAVLMNHLYDGSTDFLVDDTADAIGTRDHNWTTSSGDTRFRIVIGTVMSDGTGTIVVGFKDPGQSFSGANNDRGVIDGFAVAPGLVPEPTTFALAGLGTAALLIFRRRRQ